MCGIAGLFSNEVIEPRHIQQMTDVIRHRGPDSEGQQCLFDGKAWLGHRRLSIIDLSNIGHQPMNSAGGRYWISYNGEVYNYLELRRELEKIGYEFRSQTDTEVIIAAYAEWGSGCLQKFNGMWAFIIVDSVEHKVFIARDRFGVKPLYYWRSSQGFLALASEIKQFTVLPGWNPRMNGQRVYDFLNWGLTEHTAESLFDGVMQLRGGQAAEFRIDDCLKPLPIYTWYSLRPRNFKGAMQEAAEEFNALFVDAVRLRLRADVPVGSCLSGGLDSSSIVCVVNDLLKADNARDFQKTVSACSAEKQYDEREFIDELVHSRNIQAYYTYPQLESVFEHLNELTWHQDEPFGSTSIFAQWCVFKLAADQGLKVMLDGQGADEQLAGYHSFFAPRFAGLLKEMRWRTFIDEIAVRKKLHNYGAMLSVKETAKVFFPVRPRNLIRQWLGNNQIRPDWLDLELLQATPQDPFSASGAVTSDMKQFSVSQLTSSNLQMLLHWEDRDSMAHSVESRLPFLDYRLVEFVLGLPDDLKLSGGITKRILRSGMEGILPEKIRTRTDKMGFVTPEEVWLKNKPQLFVDRVEKTRQLSGGILKPNVGERMAKIVRGDMPFTFWPWRLISFGAWLQTYGIVL